MLLLRLVAATFLLALLAAPAAHGVTQAPIVGCVPRSGLAWCADVGPDAGPIGTKITIRGRLDPKLSKTESSVDRYNLNHSALAGLVRSVGAGAATCEILGGAADVKLHASASGEITGSFRVVNAAVCNHTSRSAHVTPGPYRVFVGCLACEVARFRVTASSLPYTGQQLGSLGVLAVVLVLTGTLSILICGKGHAKP